MAVSTSQPGRPGLKQFRSEGCYSYLFFDPRQREAVLVDPKLELLDDYREYLGSIKLVLCVDTHTHADHFSATHIVGSQFNCPIGMSTRTESGRATRRLAGGEKIKVGQFQLEVLETPGHTPDAISLFGHGMVFTGDTLMIGSSGRTDFPGADPAKQWNSLHGVLGKLPGETVLLPGHDYNDLIFSTLAHERKTNPHWLIESVDAFADMKSRDCATGDKDEIASYVKFNRDLNPGPPTARFAGGGTACGTAAPVTDRSAAISVEKYQAKLQEHDPEFAFVDVRERSEFEAGRMPGAVNIPMSEVPLHFAELARKQRVYLSCLSGRRSGMVARTLSYLGFHDVVNVTGGFKSWTQVGLPVEK